MEQATGTFDFTAHDARAAAGIPAELPAVEAALREILQAPGGDVAFDLVVALEDRLRRTLDAWIPSLCAHTNVDVEACARVRDVLDLLLAAYRRVTPASLAVDVARVRDAADLVFWAGAGQRVVGDDVWSDLISTVEAAAMGADRVSGDVPGIGRQYLRALAFEVAALDQLSGPALVAALHLVDLAVPFLSLVRVSSSSVQAVYSVDAAQTGRPVRFVAYPAPTAWLLLSDEAAGFLVEVMARMQSGQVPPSLRNAGPSADAAAAAAQHLILRWSSSSPPMRRYRRHVVSGALSVIRGLGEIRQLLGGEPCGEPIVWGINDLSRGGVGARAATAGAYIPKRGELLSFRPQDGANWHLGIVRRVRYLDGEVAIGIETISSRPTLGRVDDGRAPHDVFFCDPVQKGEAVRIAVPPNTLRAGVPLFVTTDNKLQKLKPLDAREVDEGFELRVYQVL